MAEQTNTPQLVIVDTGCANITSVFCALERLGASVQISADPAVIRAAEKVIIPGVGTAKQAMANIDAKGLRSTLQQLTQPVLGICLGMQLLTEHSAEGDVTCLGLIPGQVTPLQAKGCVCRIWAGIHCRWKALLSALPTHCYRASPLQIMFTLCIVSRCNRHLICSPAATTAASLRQ